MARGWESKSVESQIESAESRRPRSRDTEVNPEAAALTKQQESLQLSRVRVVHDLDEATNPKYQEILRAALKHLDDKLRELKAVSHPEARP